MYQIEIFINKNKSLIYLVILLGTYVSNWTLYDNNKSLIHFNNIIG